MIGRDFYSCGWTKMFAPARIKEFAITLGPWCFYSAERHEVSDRWRRHENWHKVQFRQLWYVGYPFVYIWQYLVQRIKYRLPHWEAYQAIPLEVEARRAETEPMEWPKWVPYEALLPKEK